MADMEKCTISIGAKKQTPNQRYENYDAHVTLEFRLTQMDRDKWQKAYINMRRQAKARLLEALADAKDIATTPDADRIGEMG